MSRDSTDRLSLTDPASRAHRQFDGKQRNASFPIGDTLKAAVVSFGTSTTVPRVARLVLRDLQGWCLFESPMKLNLLWPSFARKGRLLWGISKRYATCGSDPPSFLYWEKSPSIQEFSPGDRAVHGSLGEFPVIRRGRRGRPAWPQTVCQTAVTGVIGAVLAASYHLT